jgi:hypothetical protein
MVLRSWTMCLPAARQAARSTITGQAAALAPIRNAVYRARVVAWRLVGISRSAIDPALSIG